MSNFPSLGSVAPQFTASSTHGLIHLSDYKDHWVILVCNPTDFNLMRKNEWLTLAKYYNTFKAKNIAVLGISMDKNASHLPWYYTNMRGNSMPLPFPLVDDRQGLIGQAYGIAKTAETTTFIIDPNQILRTSVSTPTLGTSQIANLLSSIDTLQQSFRPPIQSIKNQPPDLNPNCDITPIVGEYVLGNPENVDATLLDFAIYAFALINADGTLLPYSTKYLQDLVNLRIENPNLKVIMAIGGWGADGFSDAALTPTSRYAFAREAQKWVRQYNLDGIDLDWEYPGSSASGITSRPQDKENFTLLIEALRDVLGDEAWISVAGTGDPSYIRNVEIDKIAPLITHFNLMAYDFNAGETGANAGTHHSNLYKSDLSLGTSVDTQVQNLINAGMPSEKILMGIPFYGRYGATSTKTFDELRRDYINKNGYKVQWDNVAKVPYLIDPYGNFAYGYDNLLSIYFKGLYIAENCLGGMFSWQSGMDKANILAKGMSDAIRDIGSLEDVLSKTYGVSTEK